MSWRTVERRGSDAASSASYPQLLMAARTAKRVSLWPMLTGPSLGASCATQTPPSRPTARQLVKVILKKRRKLRRSSPQRLGQVILLEKFKSFPPQGQTRGGIGDRAIQNRPSLGIGCWELAPLGLGTGSGRWCSRSKMANGKGSAFYASWRGRR